MLFSFKKRLLENHMWLLVTVVDFTINTFTHLLIFHYRIAKKEGYVSIHEENNPHTSVYM